MNRIGVRLLFNISNILTNCSAYLSNDSLSFECCVSYIINMKPSLINSTCRFKILYLLLLSPKPKPTNSPMPNSCRAIHLTRCSTPLAFCRIAMGKSSILALIFVFRLNFSSILKIDSFFFIIL